MNAREGFVDSGAVVPSISIENLINQRAAVMDKARAALQLLAEARALAGVAHVGFPHFQLDERRYYSMVEPDRLDETMKAVQQAVDSGAWKYLMNESGLRTFMDAEARRQWDSDIYDGKAPPLTKATVESTFRGLYASRGDMFDRGVIRCFKRLSWNYKTNLPVAFGKRIVVTGLLHTSFGGVNYREADQLDDLMRVMSVLDGKSEPDHRQGFATLLNRTSTETENAYLHIRVFKNGNGHVTFKRADLRDRMNKILAKHFPGALPAPRGKA